MGAFHVARKLSTKTECIYTTKHFWKVLQTCEATYDSNVDFTTGFEGEQ